MQHLDFLSDHEKDVFRTFSEIVPLSIVQQAAARQKYIDQSQSLNIMIHPEGFTQRCECSYYRRMEIWGKNLLLPAFR